MSFSKRATFEETAGAEWRANEAIRGFVEAAEHRCFQLLPPRLW